MRTNIQTKLKDIKKTNTSIPTDKRIWTLLKTGEEKYNAIVTDTWTDEKKCAVARGSFKFDLFYFLFFFL